MYVRTSPPFPFLLLANDIELVRIVIFTTFHVFLGCLFSQ